MSTSEAADKNTSASDTNLKVVETLTEPLNPLDKSYDSMGSQEVEEPHYNFDSDGEPPQDEAGDKLTIIQKRQVVKEILEIGENLGKPGRPFIVTVTLKGYFAKPEAKELVKARVNAIKAQQRKDVRIVKKQKKPPKKTFAEDGEYESASDSDQSASEPEDEPKEEPAEETVVPEETKADDDAAAQADGDGQDEEEKKEEVKMPPGTKQSVFDEDLGGIEINIIGEDGQVRQGKQFEHNRHLARGMRRPGIRTDRKIYGDDQIEKGEIFLDKPEPFQLTLGDSKVPHGLWRAIEHMRKGETARVMVKAAYGYGFQETAGAVEYPEGWTEGEKKKALQSRRTFYEIKLIDWVVRHDLLGDKNLLKTINERGVGYDRPSEYDELFMDLKVYQTKPDGTETIFTDFSEEEYLMTDKTVVTPVVKRILQSMKTGENSSIVVQSSFVEERDPEFKVRHTDFDAEQPLQMDINLKGLCTIHDLYRDKSCFYKSLKKGQGTASPYYDCMVTLRVKIEIDGEQKIDQFDVACHEESGTEVIGGQSSEYDLEEYTVPGALRKLLKITKPLEVVQMKCTKNDRLVDQMDDETHGVFKLEWFENMKEIAIITVQLLHIEQKEYIFKLPAKERVDRVIALKEISTKLFKAQKLYKAAKIYIRIHDFFKSKDSKGNFIKEEITEEFLEAIAKLKELEKTNLTNLAVINIKQGQFARTVEFCEKAIELEPENAYTPTLIKAYFLMGKALIEHTEFTKAKESFEKLVKLATDNDDSEVATEATAELNRAKTRIKQYQDKFAAMAKKMFK